MVELTADVARDLLEYDQATGALRWKPRDRVWFQTNNSHAVWNSRYAGKQALATVDRTGYCRGPVLGKNLLAHRVAWLVHHGSWPSDEIDHIDGDKTNNRLSNLRDVGRAENCQNTKRRRNNKSGHNGVCFESYVQKWSAYIGVDGRSKRIGHFDNKEAAITARREAEIRAGYHANHGRAA